MNTKRLLLLWLLIKLTTSSLAYALPPTQRCAGEDCDGKDPLKMGCAKDAVTIAEANLSPPNAKNVFGKIELRWSEKCRTVWARTEKPNSVRLPFVRAEVSNDKGATFQSAARNKSAIWSPMIFVADNKIEIKACGALARTSTSSSASGCTKLTKVNTADDQNEAIKQSREKWEGSKFDHYVFEITMNCFCVPELTQPIVIEVKDGEPVTITYANGDEIENDVRKFFAPHDTLDKVFDLITGAVKEKADRVEVEYDVTLGYPTKIMIDRSQAVADDEVFYAIRYVKKK
jgi:hypothetical protein